MEATGGSGWGLFGNLFGGVGNARAGAGGAPAATAAPDTAAILNAETTTAERPSAARRASASGWSRQTQVEGERSARVESARAESARVESARVENPRVENPRVETGAIATKSEPVKKEAALPEPAKTGRHMRIQIAAVRTQTEAKALAAKVKREHATTLAAREPQIDQTVMGNMGSFYRVLLGPFASAQETQSVCAKLKGSGLDCLVMAQ